MARIPMLRGPLNALKPTIKYLDRAPPQVSRDRDANHEWRRWYKTARWQRLRMSILVRDLFKCQWPGCGMSTNDTSQLVADHKIAHRGDEDLFWDENNLQCLCKPCHDRLKQREESRAGRW